ncbi:hypothetical protein I79_003065 [Cricetulus griseus]|uniref:Uncharacterized protein n=1 Tax=Cricetulus griseus TaxID=10029 RepID=G3GZ14_CRIGR|nr:hypothetical protein I79_003065 [Cricetulus griseus]
MTLDMRGPSVCRRGPCPGLEATTLKCRNEVELTLGSSSRNALLLRFRTDESTPQQPSEDKATAGLLQCYPTPSLVNSGELCLPEGLGGFMQQTAHI